MDRFGILRQPSSVHFSLSVHSRLYVPSCLSGHEPCICLYKMLIESLLVATVDWFFRKTFQLVLGVRSWEFVMGYVSCVFAPDFTSI